MIGIFTVQGITFEIARVHTVDFMAEEKIELKDYLLLRSFFMSMGIVLGSFSAMIWDAMKFSFQNFLIILTMIGFGGIFLQFILLRKFRKRIHPDSPTILQDRKELYEKFR